MCTATEGLNGAGMVFSYTIYKIYFNRSRITMCNTIHPCDRILFAQNREIYYLLCMEYNAGIHSFEIIYLWVNWVPDVSQLGPLATIVVFR